MITHTENYYNMLTQVKLYHEIAKRELEKSEFKCVDRYIIEYTNDVPIDELPWLELGEPTTLNHKYQDYVKLIEL